MACYCVYGRGNTGPIKSVCFEQLTQDPTLRILVFNIDELQFQPLKINGLNSFYPAAGKIQYKNCRHLSSL